MFESSQYLIMTFAKAEFTFEEMGKLYECTCSVYKYKAETTFKSKEDSLALKLELYVSVPFYI